VSSHGNDLVTAYVWYALAQRNHYKHSDRRMKDLAEKMTQNNWPRHVGGWKVQFDRGMPPLTTRPQNEFTGELRPLSITKCWVWFLFPTWYFSPFCLL